MDIYLTQTAINNGKTDHTHTQTVWRKASPWDINVFKSNVDDKLFNVTLCYIYKDNYYVTVLTVGLC